MLDLGRSDSIRIVAGQGADALILFSLPSLSCRPRRILLCAQLHDPFDQVVRNRLIERKLEIALRSRVSCNRLLKSPVACHGRVETDVLLPRSEVHQNPVQFECGHLVTDRLLRFGCSPSDGCPYLP
jgi:hypothetical protein